MAESKYTRGDVVTFVYDGEEIRGVISCVDYFGDRVEFDILVEKRHALYKHIPQEDVK